MTLDLLISPHMIFDVSASTVTDTWKVISDDTNTSKVIWGGYLSDERQLRTWSNISLMMANEDLNTVGVRSGKQAHNEQQFDFVKYKRSDYDISIAQTTMKQNNDGWTSTEKQQTKAGWAGTTTSKNEWKHMTRAKESTVNYITCQAWRACPGSHLRQQELT